MKKINNWSNSSIYTVPLSPACKMCVKGSKMVVLITGLCPAKCYYCPLSTKKLGKDRIFANEWELEGEDDTDKLIKEAELIKATGAGITGGDPLIVWKRTKKYISILKDFFGSNFHIHMYTSGLKNGEHVDKLVSEGLDEIRFHPEQKYWEDMNKSPLKESLKNFSNSEADIAIEIPVIPKMDEKIISLIKWADEIDIKWVNLNELEFSETNAKTLIAKGFDVKDEISAAVKGSEKSAYFIINKILKLDLKIGVHYCSSSFKDASQLRNRILRRARSIARDFEVITKEGTILKGVIYSKSKSLNSLIDLLMTDFNLKNDQFFVNKEKNRIELNILFLEEIASILEKKDIKCFIIEEYPTADSLEVERIPLPV
ncbi:hypothetical protein AYK21_00910 [Thermoplasmatales archaeon SG8-52-2]|nr:MAG: hypothetical protein AYK21_00910 [Thermoplasmatales archaeon SG8-52-2]